MQVFKSGEKIKYLGVFFIFFDENDAIGEDVLKRVMDKVLKL